MDTGEEAWGRPFPGAVVRVRVELHMAFMLEGSDFDPSDLAWTDLPYDVSALLAALYPTDRERTWRLGPRGSHPVVGALLTVTVQPEIEAQVLTTDEGGAAVLDVRVPDEGRRIVGIRVELDEARRNVGGRPAGPDLTDAHTLAPFLFRPFSLSFALDAAGVLAPEAVDVAPQDRPRFVRVIGVELDAERGYTIVVDWRPDWMRARGTKAEQARVLDPRDTPLNPFDQALPRDERLRLAPPGIVIHQTGRPDLGCLSRFVDESAAEGIHYVVDLDGFVVKTVDETFRANHAGASAWEQRVSANQFTVGIEVVHTDTDPPAPAVGQAFRIALRRFTREQYVAILRLLAELSARYPVMRRRVRGHMELLVTGATEKIPGRAAQITSGTLSRARLGCPGPTFDWERLEQAGVALGPLPLPVSTPDPSLRPTLAAFDALGDIGSIKPGSKSPAAKLVKRLLFDIGYSVSRVPASRDDLDEVYDTSAREAVRAFQAHHFSGRRRAYAQLGGTEEGSAPPAGTLDRRTLQAVLEVWFAATTSAE